MSTLRIYKNGELKSMFGFSTDYENLKSFMVIIQAMAYS